MEVPEMNQPEISYQHGTCRAAVFVNNVRMNGKEVPIRKVNMSKRYKDRDGQWKNFTSLDVNDIPKMIMALTSAYMHLTRSHANTGNNTAYNMGTNGGQQSTSMQYDQSNVEYETVH